MHDMVDRVGCSRDVVLRLSVTTAVMLLAVSVAGAADAAPPAPSGEQMVEAFHSVFGNRHVRATHAKGVFAVGTFSPSPDAAKISRAALFGTQETPVLVRFSDFT